MSKTSTSKARSAARLAAVQALYQMDMEEIGLARLLGQFHEHRLGKDIEDSQLIDADVDFFDDVVVGTDGRRADIDELIEANLGRCCKYCAPVRTKSSLGLMYRQEPSSTNIWTWPTRFLTPRTPNL